MLPDNLSAEPRLLRSGNAEPNLPALATCWRLAAELAGLHAWSWDVASGRLLPDGDLERFLGLPAASLSGRYEVLLQYVHSADRAAVSETIRQALDQQGAYELAYRVLRPNGGVRWVREKGEVQRDLSDLPARLHCVALDVTDQKQAEAGQQTERTLVRELAGAATVPEAATRMLQAVCTHLSWDVGVFWLVDRSAWVLRCVATWRDPAHDLDDFLSLCRRLAPTHGEAMPGRVWESAEPLWVEDVAASPPSAHTAVAVRQGLRAGLAFPILGDREILGVMEMFRRTTCPADTGLMQIMSATGIHLAHFIERKKCEDFLQAGEERYRRITETAAEGILTLSAEGKITFVNERMARLLGYTADEVLGRSLLDYVHAESRAAAAAWLRHNRQGYEEHGDVRFRRKDGKSVWALVAAAPLLDEAQNYSGTLAMVTDVTERRELEAQFRQAQKMEAVGRLAGGVAHDFNNLLTVITGASELLLYRAPKGEEVWELAREIRDSGERAAALTRQLLTFSRKQVLAPEVLDLNAVVRRTQKLLLRVLGEDIELAAELETSLGRVNADPGQVEQVIMNLAVNARDAMPTGGKFTLRTANVFIDEDYARLRPGVRPGRYVLLAVSDTGCGMDEETRSHLFEPFFTTKGPERGTGLGLATVYGIVQQSSGHIEVFSEVGRGTTFHIYFPRSKASLPPADAQADREEICRGEETVLVVEDEAAVRALIARSLRMCGYTVLEANGGSEALRRAEEHAGPIHLLVTDVVMPGMNGRQVAERLAALRPGVRVLFLSGYSDDAVIHHGLPAQGAMFLAKPFAPELLARKVREVLEGKTSA